MVPTLRGVFCAMTDKPASHHGVSGVWTHKVTDALERLGMDAEATQLQSARRLETLKRAFAELNTETRPSQVGLARTL